MSGDKYVIEFLIDQRKCDIFSVLVSALQAYEGNKDQNGLKVIDFNSFKNGNIQTLQLDFQENIGNPKRGKK